MLSKSRTDVVGKWTLPRLAVSTALLAVCRGLLAGEGRLTLPGAEMAPLRQTGSLEVNALSPLQTPEGVMIVGAQVLVTTVGGTELARGVSGGNSSDGPRERNDDAAELGRFTASIVPPPTAGQFCQLQASGGELVLDHQEAPRRLGNDTAPESLVPCVLLDRKHPLYQAAGTRAGISLHPVTTTILDVLRLYGTLDGIQLRLEPVLDQVAAVLQAHENNDIDGDGVTSWAEFSLLSYEALGRLDIDRVIEATHLAVYTQLGVKAPRGPNIVLIVADDLGYGDVGAFWPSGGGKTPNIDRIALNGTKLTNFHVQPVCSSTRASLLSGRFHRELRIMGAGGPARAGIPRWVRTIPRFLRQAGYRTGAFGKWHLSSRQGFLPPDRGFQNWFGFYGGTTPYSIATINDRTDRFIFANYEPVQAEDGHTTDLYADQAISFIEANQGAPFFLYLSLNAPHVPLWREEEPVFSARTDWLERVRRDGIQGNRQQDYAAVVRHMDQRIGDILDKLEQLRLDSNTVVIFMSDNGADVSVVESPENPVGSNGPYRGGKATVYEGGLRVPLAIQWPGQIERAGMVDEFASVVDLWPTIWDLAGFPGSVVDGAEPLQGASLWPLLKDGERFAEDVEREAFFLFPLSGLALISPPWKLIRKPDGDHELYNLDENPGESVLLNDKHKGRLQDMISKIDSYLAGESVCGIVCNMAAAHAAKQ